MSVNIPKDEDINAQGLWTNGGATNSLTGGSRVVKEIDKIKADDINELRYRLEQLWDHDHGGNAIKTRLDGDTLYMTDDGTDP